jgi:hypothetical protein
LKFVTFTVHRDPGTLLHEFWKGGGCIYYYWHPHLPGLYER